MNNVILRSILVGLLLGAALFVMPFFLLRLVVFLLILGALFRLVGGGRFRRRGWGNGRRRGYVPAFTDRIRQMSDEEYSQFKQRYTQEERGRFGTSKSPENTINENPTNL